MIKVLLVLDDYNEMVYLQTTLKKLGFDIEGVNKVSMIPSQILIFRPQVIVITAQSHKINGYQTSVDIKKKHPKISFVLVKHGKQDFIDKLVDKGEVDACVESPVNISTLIKKMDEICHFNIDVVLEKLKKLSQKKEERIDVSKIRSLKDLESPDLPLVDLDKKRKESLNEVEGDETLNSEGDIRADGSESVQFFSPEQLSKFKHSPISNEERTLNFKNFLKKEGLEGQELVKTFFSRNRIREFSKMIRKADEDEGQEQLQEKKRDFVKALFKKPR